VTTPQVGFVSRQERFRSVPSTNDIVRAWLAEGTPEVCLAVADEQTAGRGRAGRTWTAPDGAALLLSLGFRPTYLALDRLWRLPAVVALAMMDAAEDAAGLPIGTLKLKWPNDIVVEAAPGEAVRAADWTGVLKMAGVLGETFGAGTADAVAIVGIGTNVDWAQADFPADIATSMTSLKVAARGRPVSAEALLEGFLLRLEPRVLALRADHFDVASWHERQITTGRIVRIDMPDGSVQVVRAVGVDGASGALIVADTDETGDSADGPERELLAGEVTRVRLAPDVSRSKGVTN
jgi:BirA family biotin operon repressor/biotin-[acetyl-CoA-carboxylase] ligase